VACMFLERTIANIKQYVHRQAAELVLNFDEFGCPDWNNRCEKSMMIATVFNGSVWYITKWKCQQSTLLL
jgi:hypothetical protein